MFFIENARPHACVRIAPLPPTRHYFNDYLFSIRCTECRPPQPHRGAERREGWGGQLFVHNFCAFPAVQRATRGYLVDCCTNPRGFGNAFVNTVVGK